MGYCIYYMYDALSGQGYIGQNTNDADDKRILDHVDKYQDGDMSDGAARLIRDMGGLSSALRYKFFYPTDGYGIPTEIYEGFFQSWIVNGKTAYNQLTEVEKLDLAEILHIVASRLQGRDWSNYNTVGGGFSFNKNGITTLQYIFTAKETQSLKVLQQKIPSIRTQYTLSSAFQVDLRRNPGEWKKIVYPMGQVTTTAILEEKINKYLVEELWFYIINMPSVERKMVEIFAKYAGDSLSRADKWADALRQIAGSGSKVSNKGGHVSSSEQSDKLIEEIKDLIMNKALAKFKGPSKTVQGIIKNALWNTGVDFSWNLGDREYAIFKRKFQERLDQISTNMWVQIFSGYDKNKGRFTTNIFKNFGAAQKNNDKLINWKLPHYMVDYKWDLDTKIAPWAKQLKHCPMLVNLRSAEDGSLKRDICTLICQDMFPKIDSLANKRPSRNLKNALVFRLLKKYENENLSYNLNFFNILLTIWHQYKYGAAGWITKADYLGRTNNLQYGDYIANPIHTKEGAKGSGIWWYSGRSWSVYRQQVEGMSANNWVAAGEMLSRLWKW